jgi:acetyl-CoA C-acetyltransferase
MAGKLRAKPDAYGLVTANGWYLTKQSTGIYSARPPKAPFERQDPGVLQRQIDALPHPAVTETPQGAARIETYTVVHRREGPFMGIVIGRDADGRRFVANTPNDPATLAGLERGEQVGRTGQVVPGADGQTNLFTPD